MEFHAPILGQGVPRSCPPQGRGTRRAWQPLLVSLFGLALTAQVRAQSAPPSTPTPAEPSVAEMLKRITALEAEVAAQREELSAQREQTANKPQDQAALASLLADAQEERAPGADNEPQLRLYGFADVGLQRMWADKELADFAPESNKTTFVLGNLNVYVDASPSKDVRFLAEVRFGLFPNGGQERPKGLLNLGESIDTSISDPSAANLGFTNIRWAGVIPQRAHIDWTPSDLFNVRAGLFLTPYGIWNVDHGTPTRIMVSEPLFLAAQMIPSQLLGVELYGTTQLLPWTIGYHLHVSNGRMVGQLDFSDSKALGGRVFVSTRVPFGIKLGVSGYVGDSEDVLGAASNRKVNFAYDEHAFSADLSLDIGALRIRSELVTSWTYYETGKRPTVGGLPLADAMRLGAYLMVAYQLPWYGIEPLLMCEFLRVPVPRVLPVGEGVVMPAVGLNVYFTESTMLRTQVAVAHGFDFSEHPIESRGWVYQLVSRLITAF